MKFIPTYLHGAFDYVCGFGLMLAPHGIYVEASEAERLVPQLVGLFILVQSLMTRYECGVLRVIGMRTHLWNECLAGMFLALSPWIFDFQTGATWMAHLLVGIAIVFGSLLTQERQERIFRPAF